jgi:D-beta-D-heptose 7-phosphate kinase/D-beta-D-heptose 1-phosphate adenosyltransferase
MKTLIIGDTILDLNYYVYTTREAAEAKIPVWCVERKEYILGGSANVAYNYFQLNKNIQFITLLGKDDDSNIVQEKLKGVNCKFFFDKITTKKVRLIDNNNKIVSRYDHEDRRSISSTLEETILNYIKELKGIQLIIFSDYQQGFLTPRLCQELIKYSNEKGILTFVDPKVQNYLKYKNCFCFKPNLSESKLITKKENILDIYKDLQEQLNCKNIIITCGADGIFINNKFIKGNPVNVVDVTGAGDIVLVVLAYIYSFSQNLELACSYSDLIARKSTQVIGNYVLNENDFYIKKVLFDEETNLINLISNCHEIVFTNGCFDIIHTGHLKLLKFAKKQGKLLVVGLNSDSSIKRLKGNNRPINNLQDRVSFLSELDFIDYIIVFNELTPLNLIKLLKPKIIVKGGDYTVNQVDGHNLAEVRLFNYIPDKSTSNIVKKVINSNSNNENK